MARVSGELITAQAAAGGYRPPSQERAEALAEAIGLLVQAADEAAARLTFESEPAHFLIAMDETAAR
ncbi:MAG: hypothetical protein OXI57_09820 [Rhodospirillales bacterium]|nr:hypothetical protein [Rhodospirillales bacterium]